MKDNKDKLTFFENIYYWLWYIAPNQSKNWNGTKANFSCMICTVLRILNIFWIIGFISYMLNINILKIILAEKTNRVGILITIVPIFIILIWYDLKNFQNRADIIAEKGEQLDKKERLKKKIIFFLYILISLGLYYFVPTMVESYTQNI